MSKSLLLICAPNIGVLDNWLPVVERLRARDGGAQVDVVYPSRVLFMQAKGNPTLARKADSLCRRIVVQLGPGVWLSAPRHAGLQSVVSGRGLAGLACRSSSRLARHAWLRPLARFLALLGARLSGRPIEVSRRACGRDRESADALLYDICETAKPYFPGLLAPCLDCAGFSVTHGFTVTPSGLARNSNPVRIEPGLRAHMDARLTAYLQSNEQQAMYLSRYGLAPESLVHSGITRHDPQWIDSLQGVYDDLPAEFGDDFVFVISRPCAPLLPADRKRRVIEELAELVAERDGMKVVIKQHPKEHTEGIYEQVLGRGDYGKTWIYSENHPLVLGRRCRFGLSFYSGIAVDLVWMGVPAIEYLDLRGIPEFDGADAMRDSAGNPVTEYRYWNLVRGVQTRAELRRAVSALTADPELFVRPHQEACKALYGNRDAPADGVAADMLRRLGAGSVATTD